MAEIVEIIKEGVIQYPITKPEAVIDENGKDVLQLIKENGGSYDDTEIRAELTELSAEVSGLSEKIENLPSGESEVFNAIYNQTTFDEIMEAHNAGKVVMCRFSIYVTRLSLIMDTQVYFTSVINTDIILVICYKSNTAKWGYSNHNTAHQLTPLDNGNAQITIAGVTADVATPQYVENLLGTIINGDY